MEAGKTTKTYPPEGKGLAMRMMLEHRGEHASHWAAIRAIAAKFG